MGKEVPHSFTLLEAFLSEFRYIGSCPVVTWRELLKIGKKIYYLFFHQPGALCGINNNEALSKCLEIMHETGDILYFGFDPRLRDLIILDPLW